MTYLKKNLQRVACIVAFTLMFLYSNAQRLSTSDSIHWYLNRIIEHKIEGHAGTKAIILFFESNNLDSITYFELDHILEKKKDQINYKCYFAIKIAIAVGISDFNYNRGITSYQSLLREIGDTNNLYLKRLRVDILIRLREPFRSSGTLHEGVKYYLGLLEMYEPSKDSDVITTCCHVLRGFYGMLGLMDKAIYYQEKSISYLNPNEVIKWDVWYNEFPLLGIKGVINRSAVLGSMYLEIDQPQKALVSLYKANRVYQEYKDSIELPDGCYLQMQIAIALMETEINSAYEYIKRAELIYGNYYRREYDICIDLLKGNYFFKTQNIDSSTFYLNACKRKCKQYGIFGFTFCGLINPNYYLAQIYLEQHKATMAIELLHEEIKEFESRNLRRAILQELLILRDCYSNIGNFKKATETLDQYIELSNKIKKEETENRTMSYETEQIILGEKLKNETVAKDNIRQKIIRNSFIAGSILLLILIVVLINHFKLKRKMELEQMRNRLSRDLHDDIGSTLSSINILSRTAQLNAENSGNEKIKSALEKINERSQRLLTGMSDIIWNINPNNDNIEELLSRMREYATSLLEAKNIGYIIDFPKDKLNPKLSMDIRNNLYLIFKEAVNNLSKYSGCTKAAISLQLDEKSIRLIVEDNGQGFDINAIKHRGGLMNMQHRAEELHGELLIHSEIGKGTRIEFMVFY